MIRLKDTICALLIVATTLQLNAGIREDVHSINNDKKLLDEIIQNTSYTNNVISTAYKGLCQTKMADHVFWPSSKISYFNQGKKNIDQAILKFPNNGELRYIRLLVQLNAPAFLGYNKEVTQDFNTFCSTLPFIELDKEWQLKFIETLMKTKTISRSQKELLTTLKQKIHE